MGKFRQCLTKLSARDNNGRVLLFNVFITREALFVTFYNLFAFLHIMPLLKRGLLKKEIICYQLEHTFFFSSILHFRRGAENNI